MGQAKFTLSAELRAEVNDFKKGLNKALKYSKQTAKSIDKSFSGVGKNIANIAAAMGIAFGANELMSYAKEAVELAGQISGVEEAFKKLNNISLKELRNQTKGTASDFQLMKAAVKAAEFGIDASKMPQLMQFAAVQANKMGESVDYMVESIVTGLARNSIPILDNLGLSASMLRDKMKETGDISSAALAVINEKLKESGGLSDNAGTKAARLQADFANLKAEIGKELTPAFNELFGELKANLPDIMQNAKAVASFIAQNFDLILKLTAAIGGLVLALQTAKAAQSAFNLVTKANPYVLLATVLLSVAVAISKIGDAAEKAQKQYDDFIDNNTLSASSVKSLSDNELVKQGRQTIKDIQEVQKMLKSSNVEMTQQQRAALENKLTMLQNNIKIIKDEAKARDIASKNNNKAINKEIETIETLSEELKKLQEQQKKRFPF